MKFELNAIEIGNVNSIIASINILHKTPQDLIITYCFCSGGIGVKKEVTVKNDTFEYKKDVTDYYSW